MRVITVAALALTIVSGSVTLAQEAVGIPIQVAPHTLLLGAEQGLITVHADIPFGDVLGYPELNGVVATQTFADDCGNLVARFEETAIKADLSPVTAEMVLVGTTVDGDTFTGVDTVNVRECRGRRR